jgi:glutamine amidotransferase
MIAVIDYGMGNLRSVSKALEHVAGNADVIVTDKRELIEQADRVVVPGQGAARDCMAALHQHGLIDVVREAYTSKPFLGICMGLQVLFRHSQENAGTDCLGLIPGEVRAFANPLIEPDSGETLKVPHMGWNEVWQTPHPLWEGIDDGARFYFVHSYYVDPSDKNVAIGRCHYGHDFTCAIARDNVFACQFHPEKSAADGLRLLQNFANWDGKA